MGFLDPEESVPAKNIWANELRDWIEHAWVANQVVQPFE